MTSPSSSSSSAISWTQDRSSSGMPPIIDGQKSPVAINSPVGNARPQVKSSDSLKIVEYEVRISVTPMSRQIETRMPPMMLSETMSIGIAPNAALRPRSANCRNGPPSAPCPALSTVTDAVSSTSAGPGDRVAGCAGRRALIRPAFRASPSSNHTGRVDAGRAGRVRHPITGQFQLAGAARCRSRGN